MRTEDSTQRLYDKVDEAKQEIHDVKVAVARLEGKIDAQTQQDDQHNIDLMQVKSDLKETNERVDNNESDIDKFKGALRTVHIFGGILAALFVLFQVIVALYK